MAEPEKSNDDKDFVIEIGSLLVALYFIALVIQEISERIAYSKYGIIDVWWARLAMFISETAWPLWKVVSVLVAIGAAIFIWKINSKFGALVKEERGIYGPDIQSDKDEVEEPKNEKWEEIVERINSANSADWKVAIIEADIMLEDLLRKEGYHGDTLGEMLKSAEGGDFLSLESAWEAHKIRNSIAHKGSEYPLTEREAKRAISLFEHVFKEFKII